MFRLRVVELGDIVDMDSQHFIEFEDAKRWLCIPPNYGFIWEKLHSIHLVGGYLPIVVTNNVPWVDWCLKGGPSFLQVSTNILYHHALRLLILAS